MPTHLTRRDLLRWGAAGLGCGLAQSTLSRALAAAPAGRRPNVLFIAVDDLRPQLGCYGHRQMISPNIDRLAQRGLVFSRAYCQQAVCAPTRASLLSGCRPDTTHVFDLQTPLQQTMPDVVTLPQHFKENGYTTLSLGKIYHHMVKDDPKGWSEPPWGPKNSFGYVSDENVALVQRLWEEGGKKQQPWEVRGPACEASGKPESAYADAQLADRAIETLGRVKDQPFLLAVGFYKPHLPFVCPQRYYDLYPAERIDLADNPFSPKGAPAIAMHNWGELRQYYGIPRQGDLTEEQARQMVRGYYACVSFTDAQIGRVLDALERQGLRQNTIVILWGDHGWNLGEHGLWCKHCNFETSVHAPLVISVPGQKSAGRKTEALTEFVDIYPSLAELCGLPLPDHLEGTSFVPLLENPRRPWKRAAFSQYPRGRIMGYSMRTDRHRYTEWTNPEKRVVARELYDHRKDPGENVNVVEDPANAELVAGLSSMLQEGWKGARRSLGV